MTTRRLFLPNNIFLRPDDRQCVVLDVARDQYLCLDMNDMDDLGPWLVGWQRETTAPAHRSPRSETEMLQLAAEYIEKGILSDNPDNSKPVQPDQFCAPTIALASRSNPTLAARLLYAPPFFIACAKAHAFLKFWEFPAIVQYIKQRKHPHPAQKATPPKARIEHLVANFNALRLLYPHPRESMCLFDSLSLHEFLGYFGPNPNWVFGVQAEPFQAHCWLQVGDVVVNDAIERVSQFSPIMQI